MITTREQLEVNEQVRDAKSWKLFQDFVTVRRHELDVEAAVLSEDFTKLLLREQRIGSRNELGTLLETFRIHVENLTMTKEQEEQNNEQ